MSQSVKDILVFLILNAFIFSLYGCTTYTIVEDWRQVPNKATIEVYTSDGALYELRYWKINNDSSITGKPNDNSFNSVTIPKYFITKVYVLGSQTTEETDTSIIVIGSLAIGAAIITVIYFVQHYWFGSFGGGR